MFRSARESEAESVGAALPYLDADPTRAQLPTTEDGDPMPVQYVSDGSTGVSGDSGDVCVAVPNDSGGVDVAVMADIGDLIAIDASLDTGGLL